MTFSPFNFVKNLYYMGMGMLGIFVAVGIIVLFTIALNRVTNHLDAVKQAKKQLEAQKDNPPS